VKNLIFLVFILITICCTFTPEYILEIENPYSNNVNVYKEDNTLYLRNISDLLLIRVDYNINDIEKVIFKAVAPLESLKIQYLYGEDYYIKIRNVGFY
jgi:hypothetical protein